MTDASLRLHGIGDDRFPEGWKMSKLQDVSTRPPPALLVCQHELIVCIWL